ncbi:type 1 glutamine amidotransferase [Aliikangiella marina]|uniref:Type 1 glutamine amidotransferase n=1 Tax=Aliikangiella marina TaxID=1712262 RepID=A0A545T7D8_9GAMM|nr:type 1 glutamine amidotransferase [Aliikangiella marina]TQV73136.1 type 1 glutamine amidotransferase [Aliikangiella marina]
MEKARNKLKILLMQIRKDRQVAAEELTSFARHANLDDAQFDILNVFKTPYFDHSILKGYDALWVGGASEANVLYPQKYPFIESAKKLLSRCCDIDFPVFASCFGFQLAVLALGGEVVDSFDDDFEMGTIPINIAVQGKKDLLMRDIENPFLAVSVHKQKVLKLPENCELLAETNVCVHAFKVKGKPFWAFQFHPEVDRDILVERLTIYKQKYTQNDAQLDQVLAHAVETPDANALMNKFVDRVLLGRG